MKQRYLPILFVLFLLPFAGVADPIDKVASLIKQGNAHGLAEMFAPNIEIAILTEENVYSKAQAEQVLEKFFIQNKSKTVQILHRVNSSQNYRFGVLILTTDRGTFRVAFTLKDDALIELRIETEKVK
ncbi:hypothetical protein BH09BAC6_BH09BAC6_35710 [soil metagenome]|jgi:pyridoxal/pyridoxine/pyridoxamine kinase